MPKQVIVMRKDLGMRKGKMIAQGAHASMKVIIGCAGIDEEGLLITFHEDDEHRQALKFWLTNKFKKICVGVSSEEELDEIFAAAMEAGLPCAMVEDNGATEFHGIKTKTCCGIGPADSDEIDKITGHLKLL